MDDCYFFLYSSCKFKDRCTYRHNESCRNNLITCRNWVSKIPCSDDCPYRHSKFHLKKNRREEMCYWEDKPSGCIKDRCEYRHANPLKDAWKGMPLPGEMERSGPSTSAPPVSDLHAPEDTRLKDYEEVMDAQDQITEPRADGPFADAEPMEEAVTERLDTKENSGLADKKKGEGTDDRKKIESHGNVLEKYPVEDAQKLQNKRVKAEKPPSSISGAGVDLEDLDKEIEELDSILMK
uniref:C3H1-type domain-containing protein n=1 Tax=Encephalitozoon cuniculi TaxID=6035 RepID=M1K487_ENCCN|nr:hypothetical protein ECU06_0290 [Encephalitozoon cuniculi]